jgi:putative membrane protein
MYGYLGGAAWGWGVLGTALTLLLWGGLILGIVWLVRGGLGAGERPALPRPPQPPEDRALAILRERYARGEIDSAEYEERRRRLLDEIPTL